MPFVAGAVVFKIVGEAGEGGNVLIILAAHFVDHKVERGDDEDAKAASAGFVEGVARCAGDVGVGVVLELEREGAVGIVFCRLVTECDVVGGDELLVFPFSVVKQAVAEAQGVGGVDGDAASAVGVGHDKVAAMQAIIPCAPAHGLGEALVDVIF